MKCDKFSGKGEFRKIFHGVWKIFWNRENLKQVGIASLS